VRGAGKFDRAMRLERPDRIEAADGHADLVFVDVDLVFVALKSASPGEQLAGGRLEGVVTHRAIMRARSDIAGGWRLVEGARSFRVLAVSDHRRREGEIDLALQEEGR
jgi:head-tail adaptor